MINMANKYLGIGIVGKIDLMNYYNENVYPLIEKNRKYRIQSNDEWCAMFCSVMAHKVGYKKGQFPFEVSVFYMVKNARSLGTFKTDSPRVNDLIIYDWHANGTLDHVGIVYEVNGNIIKVIEGNYNKTVKVRTIKLPNKEVYGYISTVKINVDDDVTKMAKDVLKGVYGYGDERRVKLGSNYRIVQDEVNRLMLL